jgi:hypothetical protein
MARRTSHEDSVKTLQLSYRPYVGVRGSFDLRNALGNSHRKIAAITLEFTAMGASPALNVVVSQHCVATQLGIGTEGHITPPPKALPT